MSKVGVADTCFSRVDMAKFVLDVFKDHSVVRYTVPGLKDLPVACKKLFVEEGCDIVLALGMAGPMPIDKQCSHEASISLQQVQLEVCKHILEIFVHMDEAKDDNVLFEIAKNRAEKHAVNALKLLEGKDALRESAGQGRRQGKDDVGPVLGK